MNAISDLPLFAKLMLAFLAIITLWLISDNGTQHKHIQPQVHRTSDYAMTDFTLTVMGQTGEPSRVIIGREMSHYPEDDSTEVIQPVAQFIEPGKETWVVMSDKAQTKGKGENILLTGNVIITQKDNADIELRTEKLNLDTKHNTAYTDLAVSMKSPHGETHSVGLHAALEDETINLHSRVRGRYDAPATK